ncbi:MAG TPA: hypothetical protein VG168_15510 [Bryobacteraceae bacterium]|nr:hypothetical protein [Bryobacteraceae bacterium]
MKRLIYVFANLYPRWWRDRYGAEFDALIEDEAASLGAAVDVLTEALLMQIRTLAEGKPLPLDDLGAMGLLMQNWWLLAFSGIVQAAISAIYLLMQSSSGPITFHAWNRTVTLLGYLELTAGITASAAGLVKSKNHKSWLLVLNGIAFMGLGLIHSALMRFPVSFIAVATLVIVMALSIGMLALRIARGLRARELVTRGRATAIMGLASIGFVAPFVALSLRWIRFEPGYHTDLFWLGSYFAFSAVCMLGFALQVHGRSLRRHLR